MKLFARRKWNCWWPGCVILALALTSCGRKAPLEIPEIAPGICYTNILQPKVPWSIHVARVNWRDPNLDIHSVHALNAAMGMTNMSEIIRTLDPKLGTPIAAVNGDFYSRDRDYIGDPRGLQIVDGEVISAPVGGISFWISTNQEPQMGKVESRFTVRWPNGETTPFGLNQDCKSNELVLYTPSMGSSTHTANVREIVLERVADERWLPLQLGEKYLPRVREVRERGDTPLTNDFLVLCVSPELLDKVPKVAVGDVFEISTDTLPQLKGIDSAISGGPMLVREGKRQKFKKLSEDAPLPYEFRSMWERHPRVAVGWTETSLFLMLVDGRQKKLSVGMTLDELAKYMVNLGCLEAMNLDGGGSATMWCNGSIRNSPADKREREIANALILLKKPGKQDLGNVVPAKREAGN